LYVLRWETALQKELGGSIIALLRSLSSSIIQNVLATTVLASLASAVMIPAALLQLTNVIDNLWTIAVERADEAGVELAKALIQRIEHGGDTRPVTLIGYSVGARVIVSCLRELVRIISVSSPAEAAEVGGDFTQATEVERAEVTEEDPLAANPAAVKVDASLIGNIKVMLQDVILLGAPVNVKSRYWASLRSLVCGRFVNGYSKEDMVLRVLYRVNRMRVEVAGVGPINQAGIENIDLSDIVKQHTDYLRKMKSILEYVSIV